MMVLNHGFSGYVCGRVAMPLLRRHAPLSEQALGWAFFLGAMLPDGDVISRLAGHGVYFGHAWYSHRQASHSLLGTAVLALLVGALLYWPWRRGVGWRGYGWAVGCLWAGGLLHLVGDLVTPGRALALFWPLPARAGALSHIGWFSPYLAWMFAATFVLDGALRGVARVRPAWRPLLSGATWLLYAATAYRWLHYLYISRYLSPTQWVEYQRTLLPDVLVASSTEGVSLLWGLIAR
jgi:membrane-bound metal-dependent hydrolase YbcI (DUF457 family)